MTSVKKNIGDKSSSYAKLPLHDDGVDHAAEADMAKLHLRNDKDWNKAYPLDEKTPVLPARKGE